MDKLKNQDFLAFRVDKISPDIFSRSVQKLNLDQLPEGDVTVKVQYSGLNYKDALSAFGRPGVTRNYPHTPGIDASGIVVHSKTKDFQIGQEVIVSSYDLGMDTDGGFGQYIRVPQTWVVPLPQGMSLRESMIAGTAGLTAAQAVWSLLEAGQKPESGPVIVTGARGAVGSYSLSLLAHLGFEVVAAVSKLGNDTQNLIDMGATEVIDSNITNDSSGRALLSPRWSGGIDTIGDNTLATILKSIKYGGNVVCVGNIQSGNLATTVYPFIIRGLKLIGVATQDTPMELRKKLWNLLANDWKIGHSDKFTTEIGLGDLELYLEKMINKSSRGRILLNLWT